MRRRLSSRLRAIREEPLVRGAPAAFVRRLYWSRRFEAFGKGSFMQKPDWVYGPHKISIGEGVMIYAHVSLSVERPAWSREGPAIRLGNGVIIRPYCSISAAESVEFEDHSSIGSFSSVVDADHSFEGPSENPVWNPMRSTPIRIGRATTIGERTAILRGARIGRHCFIGANSVVTGEIPDFSIAVGAPARVVGSTEADVRARLEREARG